VSFTFADDQICRLALTPAGCPLGPTHCPLRHTTPSSQNFQAPRVLPTHPRERERLSTVCKHWLRGLCKKGDACEFLHEYNLRRMPECWWFAKYGYCSAGDECLYAHPKERKVECPDYNRGFCKLGESSSVVMCHLPLLTKRCRSYVPTETHSQSRMPVIPDRFLSARV
jgi:cleavage and polyadenylation specificity factor subunit 4